MDKWTPHALAQYKAYEHLAMKDITVGLSGDEQGLLLALGTALGPLPVQSYYSQDIQAPASAWKKAKTFTLKEYYDFLNTLQPQRGGPPPQQHYAFSPVDMSLEKFDQFITQPASDE